jgi:hypothetical protein
MSKMNCITLIGAIGVAITLSSSAIAQNSYLNMLGTIQSTNQSLWAAQRALEQAERAGSGSSSPSPAPQPGPAVSQPYGVDSQAILATSFPSSPGRILPGQLIYAMSGATLPQKQMMRAFYEQLFASYEQYNPSNNVAMAVAYALGTSMAITRGRQMPAEESAQLVMYLNQALASSPQFNAMTPQQKQLLYESSILSGGMLNTLYYQGYQLNNPAARRQADEMASMIVRQWTGQ